MNPETPSQSYPAPQYLATATLKETAVLAASTHVRLFESQPCTTRSASSSQSRMGSLWAEVCDYVGCIVVTIRTSVCSSSAGRCAHVTASLTRKDRGGRAWDGRRSPRGDRRPRRTVDAGDLGTKREVPGSEVASSGTGARPTRWW